ncbi:MAG: hypothetical protein JNL69_01685 [Bacteroidia bacterium]|nr:hypothetical protein [Bacteroidia bacterium]
MNPYYHEASRITSYLLSMNAQQKEQEVYASAMEKLSISFSAYEQALWKSMMSSTFKMACIDAGLALTDSTNNVRRKLFTMLAILEASPNYTACFLSKEYSKWYFLKLIFVGMRSICRAMIGLLIIKIIKQRCS